MTLTNRLLSLLLPALLWLGACGTPDRPVSAQPDTVAFAQSSAVTLGAQAVTGPQPPRKLTSADSNTVIQDVLMYGGPYSAGTFFINSAQQPIESIRFKRMYLWNRIDQGEHFKWGFRLYDLKNSLFKFITVRGINKEHAVYLNVIGGLTIQDCIFEDCGAQGIQIAWRSIETSQPDSWQVAGVHRIENTLVNMCGQERGQGRAAFSISMFGKQNQPYTDPQGVVHNGPRSRWDCPVEIVNTRIINTQLTAWEIRGALMVEHRPRLLVDGGSTEFYGSSDSDLWHIYKVDEVVVKNHHFVGQRFVDITDAQRISFQGCTGTVRIRVNGVKMGLVNQDFEWTK